MVTSRRFQASPAQSLFRIRLFLAAIVLNLIAAGALALSLNLYAVLGGADEKRDEGA